MPLPFNCDTSWLRLSGIRSNVRLSATHSLRERRVAMHGVHLLRRFGDVEVVPRLDFIGRTCEDDFYSSIMPDRSCLPRRCYGKAEGD